MFKGFCFISCLIGVKLSAFDELKLTDVLKKKLSSYKVIYVDSMGLDSNEVCRVELKRNGEFKAKVKKEIHIYAREREKVASCLFSLLNASALDGNCNNTNLNNCYQQVYKSSEVYEEILNFALTKFLVSSELTESNGDLCSKACRWWRINTVDVKSFDSLLINEFKGRVNRIIENSFPELVGRNISYFVEKSNDVYFRTSLRPRGIIKIDTSLYINRNISFLDLKNEAYDGVIYHELEHLVEYYSLSRFKLIKKLLGLVNRRNNARFERATDFRALLRMNQLQDVFNFEALRSYRIWLYQNISLKSFESRGRNYFSPEEIELLEQVLPNKPELIKGWVDRPPMSIADIEKEM